MSASKFLFLIAIGLAIWLWQNDKLPFFAPSGAFDESGKPVVLFFAFDECGAPCQDSLKELRKRKVPFQEVDVDPNDKEGEEFKLWVKMGSGEFPFIVSGNEKVVGSSKAQLVSLLGNNFGDQYLTAVEKRYFKIHFNADGSPKVVMYGADWCQYCAKLRDEFENDGMEFVEIDVEKSGEKEQMSQVMEIAGYPATWVGYTRVKGTTLRDVKTAMR